MSSSAPPRPRSALPSSPSALRRVMESLPPSKEVLEVYRAKVRSFEEDERRWQRRLASARGMAARAAQAEKDKDEKEAELRALRGAIVEMEGAVAAERKRSAKLQAENDRLKVMMTANLVVVVGGGEARNNGCGCCSSPLPRSPALTSGARWRSSSGRPGGARPTWTGSSPGWTRTRTRRPGRCSRSSSGGTSGTPRCGQWFHTRATSKLGEVRQKKTPTTFLCKQGRPARRGIQKTAGSLKLEIASLESQLLEQERCHLEQVSALENERRILRREQDQLLGQYEEKAGELAR